MPGKHPRLRATLPLVLVLALLFLLIVVPIIVQRRVADLQAEVSEAAEPARLLVSDIQTDLAREIAATRGFLLTRDTSLLRTHLVSQARRNRAFGALVPLSQRLGPEVHAPVVRMGELLRPADALIDSLYLGRVSAEQYIREVPVQQARLESVNEAAAAVDEAIGRVVIQHNKDALVIARTGTYFTVALAFLSIIAALLIARLGRSYRLLAARLERRSRWRQALNEAARELSYSTTLEETVQATTDRAVSTTHAFGSYIELMSEENSQGDVEVVAVSGKGCPPLHTRLPYPGSLSEKIIESEEPEILGEVDAIGELMAPYLRKSCRDCTGLVIPLIAEGRFLGALVLLRAHNDEPFGRDETAYVRAVGDLATAAIRRVMLLERVTEAEERFRQIADHLDDVIWLGTPDLSTCYYVNPAYEAVSGRSVESFYQDPASALKFVHPEDLERLMRALEGIFHDGFEIEYRIIRPDGAVRWIWSRGYPIRNENGNVFRIAGILEDITEQKLAEEERERLLSDVRTARDKLNALLESIAEAFYALDRSERFTYVNREAERILKQSREDLIGRNIWDAFPALAKTPAYHEYRRALREGKEAQFETYYEPLHIWVDIHVYPTEEGISVLFQDITERRRAEQALRESEQNFRALGNSIPQLAWMADANGRLFWHNQRWLEYTGTDAATMRGMDWTELIHPDHRDRVARTFHEAVRSGRPWEDTFPIRSQTGAYRWFLSRAVPIRDEGGHVTRYFGTKTDVTGRIKAAEEREQLLQRERQARQEAEQRGEEVRRVTESRATLVRGFSHDVKNPLGAADGYLQLLEEGIFGELIEKQRESVHKVRRSIRSALDLIEDLLGLARAEVGDIDITCEPTDVREVAQEAAEEYRAQAEAKGLELSVNGDPDVPLIESDPDRIRQIIGNLLSNAVKYTPHGRVDVSVRVREDGTAPRPGRWICIDVHDTGPGISEDQQQIIFREFHRAPTPTAESGMGIGLTISRRIAHALDGEITLESQPGHGSDFMLWLPLPT